MTVSYTLDQDILVITVTGSFDLNEALKVQERARKLIAGKKAEKVLIDIRKATIYLSLADIYMYITTFAPKPPARTKQAVLYSSKAVSPQDVNFGERVAENRDINIRMFTFLREAKAWLNSD